MQVYQEDLGQRVGKNRSTVTNYLRLLKLPSEIQVAIRDKKLSMGHARSLVAVEKQEDQMELFDRCLQDEWSVRKLEEAIRRLGKSGEIPQKGIVNVNDIKKYQVAFSTFFHSNVSFKMNENGKGEIKIQFKSQEELDKLLKAIQ